MLPRVTAASPSFGSPSSLSESSQWESTSKRPFALPNRNIQSRRAYMSKAVYPLMFHNPVSDCETFGDADTSSVGRLTPSEDHISPSHWFDSNSSTVQKFHRTLTELQRLETSPDPGASSRREGFRWSSASSYDFGFDGERFDIAEHIDVESLRSPIGAAVGQKCGVCGKLLSQKSPWSSHRIMRGGDMPTAGVLPCSHVFHAECLEQLTPKTQIHEPPCPLCQKIIGPMEESSSFSEPLHMALRSVQRSRGIMIPEAQGDHRSSEASNHIRSRLRASSWNESGSSLKNRLKRHFTFKMSKDIFSTKMFQRIGSSSSTRQPVQRQMSIG
ncbi:RING/U-box superfamily protein [Melia azedarach]|uniref:RING/U-box superfamily protein n=1 Tax=Melia azedarach TaxID=155640 RepID=A0ACC1YDK3_MELAZ|nr:RING/U-box superfamily protein [Melia azedarach]